MSKEAPRNLQRERNERGQQFQEEIRRSWLLIPNCWRLRIKDGGGGTRPADELVLLDEANLLSEHKRTAGNRFQFSMLRPDQVTGLLDFDSTLERNKGLVFVSFHNPEKGLDDAYAFRLVVAMAYMHRKGLQYISRDDLESKVIPCAQLPRLEADEPTYDLRGLVECCKSL